MIDLIKLIEIEFKNQITKLENDVIEQMKHNDVYIESGAYSKYGQTYENEKIFTIINNLIPMAENLAKIEFSLDSRIYKFSIGDFYKSLFDSTFHLFVKNPHDLNKIIINRLNEFIINYNQKLIPFTIIVPLKGVRIQIQMEENSYEKICFFKSNVEESGVYIYNNLLIMTSNEITLNSKLIGRNNNITEGRIGIYDRSEIKFSHLIDPKFLSDQENDDNNINSGLFFYLSQ